MSTFEEMENPVLTALAEADRVIEEHLDGACDGDARAGELVASATTVRRLAELLSKVRPGVRDLEVLSERRSHLRGMLSGSRLGA